MSLPTLIAIACYAEQKEQSHLHSVTTHLEELRLLLELQDDSGPWKNGETFEGSQLALSSPLVCTVASSKTAV